MVIIQWPPLYSIYEEYCFGCLFRETLRYASTQKPGTDARWDGNIAETAFADPDGTHTYAYIYDGMGRLTDAKHYAGASNTATNARTERFFSYDRNGNITGLTKYDEAGTGTPLSSAFTSNRIAADTYDAMGNLHTDSRKGLEFSYSLAFLSIFPSRLFASLVSRAFRSRDFFLIYYYLCSLWKKTVYLKYAIFMPALRGRKSSTASTLP